MFGVVPKIQSKVLSYHFWPKKIRSFLSSETGPFTGINNLKSILLGPSH